jgi:hypothetical protein
VAVAAATSAVGAVTAANRLGAFRLDAVAATPRAVGEGKLWVLLSSLAVADRPIAASLLGFAVVAFAALLVCGARAVVVTGLAGHVLSTLAVYGMLGGVRLVDHTAFEPVLSLPDYGLSAAIAAWLGAVASVSWRRRPSAAARAGVVGICLAALAIGLALRPDLTVLDSEHLVAFALGVALVRLPLPRLRVRLLAAGRGWPSRTSA